jgi:hypothetical protein
VRSASVLCAQVLKRNQQNRDLLLYWLGTLTALLHLVRIDLSAGTLNSSSSVSVSEAPNAAEGADPETSRSTSSTSTPPGTRRGDPPIVAFVASLTSIAEAFFDRAVTMLVAQIDPLLVPAVLEGDMSRPERNAAPNARLLDVLGGWHRAVTETHRVAPPIVAQLFVAVFDEMGVRLLNALFDRRDLCACGSALQSKMHASALVQWAQQRKLPVQ